MCVQNASEEKTAGFVLAGASGDSEESEKARVASAVGLASARSELAGLLHEQGKLSEAEELYRCVFVLIACVCACGESDD